MSGVAQNLRSLTSGTLLHKTSLPPCPMSSSIGPETTWRALIDPFRQRLDSYKQTPISSEEDFRALLKPLCEKHREFDFQRLIIRIRKQHSPIIDLARGIDSALELKEPAEFTALIWGISYTAIRVSTVSQSNQLM
jgi:hypothetical protein